MTRRMKLYLPVPKFYLPVLTCTYLCQVLPVPTCTYLCRVLPVPTCTRKNEGRNEEGEKERGIELYLPVLTCVKSYLCLPVLVKMKEGKRKERKNEELK